MKTWIKINLGRITLVLAILSLIIATTGLILGAKSNSKTNDLQYYLGHQYTVYWGGAGTTIWSYKANDEHKINLYFGIKPKDSDDIKWDGVYPKGYFDND